jgi:hypothetical protein
MRARDPITRLQRAIECLPARTRRAMLDGIRSQPIVAGAYTDGDGGVCPMLAAHRRGGRTDHLAFAKAWDAYTRARGPRRATERELRTLEDLLRASLERDGDTDFATAIAEHRALWYRSQEFPIDASRSSPPAAAGEAARTA